MQRENEHSCATIDIIETYSGPEMYLDSAYKRMNAIALQVLVDVVKMINYHY